MSPSKILYQATIVDSNGKAIKSTDVDALSLDIEPVTGKAIGGNIASGVYLKVGGNSPLYGPNVKPTIIPYFSVTSTQKASGEEIDMLYAMAMIGQLLDQLPILLYAGGGIFFVIGTCLVLYGIKCVHKSGKSQARTSTIEKKLRKLSKWAKCLQ